MIRSFLRNQTSNYCKLKIIWLAGLLHLYQWPIYLYHLHIEPVLLPGYDMIWYDMIWYDMIWYDMMGPMSYMRSVVDRNVVMRRIHVVTDVSIPVQNDITALFLELRGKTFWIHSGGTTPSDPSRLPLTQSHIHNSAFHTVAHTSTHQGTSHKCHNQLTHIHYMCYHIEDGAFKLFKCTFPGFKR